MVPWVCQIYGKTIPLITHPQNLCLNILASQVSFHISYPQLIASMTQSLATTDDEADDELMMRLMMS
jgi:hypothetical protein